MVDTSSEHYLVAREYMVRLNSRDLEDVGSANKLADAAGMRDEEFVRRFTPVLESDAMRAPAGTAHRA
jgi:6-phosphofructokinase 1